MTAWNSEKLWLKAKLFIDEANQHDNNSTMFAFWSALSLECLARSALTHIHPALNADFRNHENLLYGFGFQITAQPRSLPAHSVYIRLELAINDFGKRHRELCDFVALNRNAHLHTADLPFENLTPAKWLPRFYETAKVLNEYIGKNLLAFLGDDVSSSAEKLIKSLNKGILSSVMAQIAKHGKAFQSKSEDEQKQLIEASRLDFFVQGTGDCPACGARGALSGEKVKEFPAIFEEGELLVEIQYMTTGFKCNCCGFILKGVGEIAHAEIDTHFTKTISTSLHELYEPEFYQEYDNM